MAKMSGQVAFSANLEGALNLSMGTDLAKVDTTWKGLKHPSFERDQEESVEEEGSGQEDGDEGEGGDGDDSISRKETKKQNVGRRKIPKAEMRSVTLEMRSFMRFLSSYNVETSTIACICIEHCAIFYVYIGDQENTGGVMTVSAKLADLCALLLTSSYHICSSSFLASSLTERPLSRRSFCHL